MEMENKYLQIQGRVAKNTLDKLMPGKKQAKSRHWFFVDYSVDAYDRGAKFNIVLEGEEKKMLPRFYNIKLHDVFDQFGNPLEAIPAGWKTICSFEFDHIPRQVSSLPLLHTWEYNPESVKIANSNDLVVDSSNLGPEAFARFLYYLIMSASYTNGLNIKHFLQDIVKIYEEKDELKEKIPSKFISQVKEKIHEV